jgi:FKBP-type peptidyl-prolyl cis-trans isomerase 2
MIKKGDFIQINYTGRVKDTKQVFDTTIESVAHESGMEHSHGEMKPITICVGEGHLLPALDKKLEGKELGKHTFELGVDEAFGKKDTKLLKLVPLSKFHKEKINPFPGLTITIDDRQGTVRAVSGGRVIVDFNHPVSGQEVVYELDAMKEVTDKKEQVEAILAIRQFPIKSVAVNDNKADIEIQFKLPKEIETVMADELKRTVKLDAVTFKEEKPEKAEATETAALDKTESKPEAKEPAPKKKAKPAAKKETE